MNDVINEKSGLQPPEAVTNIQPQPFAKPIGAEQVKKFNEILEKYKSGKVKTICLMVGVSLILFKRLSLFTL